MIQKNRGGGNASQYGKRNRACKDFLNMMSNAAAVIVELARMALDEGDTRRAAVFVRDAANIRDILKRHATK